MISRLLIYLKEMFPLPAFIGSMLSALSTELIYLRLYGASFTHPVRLWAAALAVTCISLLIRVMDEFKDYEDDLKNFPHRPLPSGKVLKNDLKVLGFLCVGLVLVLSASSLELFLMAILCLSYTFLMLKWFFIEEKMRKSLPLAFLSHHPIVLLNFFYLMVACQSMEPNVGLGLWPFVLPICLIYTNWELLRKIRPPEQETAYTTYSKILGPRRAMIVGLIFQFGFAIGTFFLFSQLETPRWIWFLFGGLMALCLYPCVRFLFLLKLKEPLKAVAEKEILLVVMSLLAAAFL